MQVRYISSYLDMEWGAVVSQNKGASLFDSARGCGPNSLEQEATASSLLRRGWSPSCVFLRLSSAAS